MKILLFLQILTSIIFTIDITAQSEINQMSIFGEGEFIPGEIISKDVVDANGEVCAGLMIQTDLSGLSFTSYNGIVKLNER